MFTEEARSLSTRARCSCSNMCCVFERVICVFVDQTYVLINTYVCIQIKIYNLYFCYVRINIITPNYNSEYALRRLFYNFSSYTLGYKLCPLDG